jgi:type III pantothenate kinase
VLKAQAALPADDVAAWRGQIEAWGLTGPLRWIVSGVHPARRDSLMSWLQGRGDFVHVVTNARQLPLEVKVEHPDRVGIDRLLNAVAANRRRPAQTPAIIVDAGSAITVDWVDANGAFRGGAILPGMRLMAQALHDHTALLPLVEVPRSAPPLPGTSTVTAIEAGVFWAAAGAIRVLIEQFLRLDERVDAAETTPVFLTGGDALLLSGCLAHVTIPWPSMTLEGILLCSEAVS